MQANLKRVSFMEELRQKASEIVRSASDLSLIQISVIILLALFIIAGGIFSYIKSKPRSVKIISSKKTSVDENRIIKVHVAGAVLKPGLYEVREGMRVADAIKAAGGESTDADVEQLNLAERLRDGQKIMVPQKCAGNSLDDPLSAGYHAETSTQSKKININTATAEELESLPGIGPALASRIIKYRREKGFFTSVSGLKNVPGIGQRKFESLKDLVEI